MQVCFVGYCKPVIFYVSDVIQWRQLQFLWISDASVYCVIYFLCHVFRNFLFIFVLLLAKRHMSSYRLRYFPCLFSLLLLRASFIFAFACFFFFFNDDFRFPLLVHPLFCKRMRNQLCAQLLSQVCVCGKLTR